MAGRRIATLGKKSRSSKSRKGRGTKPATPSGPTPKLAAKVSPPPSPDPLDAPIIQQLVGEILQHHRTIEAESVETRAEVGRLLVEIRKRTDHGDWERVTTERLPFGRKTANRAIDLHHYATQQTERYDQIKSLGLSHVYLLIGLPPSRLDELLAGGPYLVPSTGVVKPLNLLTYTELFEVVHEPDPEAPSLDEALLRAYRRSGRKLIGQLDALIDQRALLDRLDRDDLVELYDDMVHTLTRFAEAFGLDED
jgi:hypothetical protein